MAVTADFNGDGFDDLAVGVNGENGQAGAVNVIYGTATGLNANPKVPTGLPSGAATANQLWTQSDVGETSEVGDQFGRTLAAGDFDGDGFDDLAVGAPFEDRNGANAGLAHVIYGSAAGLTAAGAQVLGGFSGPGANFGAALTVGDYNGDSFDDLAVGAPGATELRGRVEVFFASDLGFTPGSGEPALSTQVGAEFGAALASGDFDGDGFDDLAVGAPGANVGTSFPGNGEGSVIVASGSVSGFSSSVDYSQGLLQGGPEEGDRFGASLAAGDFDGDGFDDLAVGAPFEDSSLTNVGVAHVLYGRAIGLTALDNQLWTQDSPGIADVAEAGDFFGVSLVAGDFNGDGVDDLAIGASREDLAGGVDAGAVHVLPGSTAGGLTAMGSQFWHQDIAEVEDATEASDQFGFSLGTGDFNGDGEADLAVGVIGENNAGAVNVLYGTAAGLSAAGDQLWGQDSAGVRDVAEPGDFFGVALAGSSGIGNAGFSGAWEDVTQRRNQVRGTLAVTNPGLDAASASVVRFYLSADATLDGDDRLVQRTRLRPLGSQRSVQVRLRARLRRGQDATGGHLIAVLDANNDVFEVNEGNNVVVSGPIPPRSVPPRRLTGLAPRWLRPGSRPHRAIEPPARRREATRGRAVAAPRSGHPGDGN